MGAANFWAGVNAALAFQKAGVKPPAPARSVAPVAKAAAPARSASPVLSVAAQRQIAAMGADKFWAGVTAAVAYQKAGVKLPAATNVQNVSLTPGTKIPGLGGDDFKKMICGDTGPVAAAKNPCDPTTDWTRYTNADGDLLKAVLKPVLSINAPLYDLIGTVIGKALQGCGESFTENTEVFLADGTSQPIGQIKVGDKVRATDPGTGQTSARTVTTVWINHDTDLLDLTVETGGVRSVIHTTEHHRFFDDTTHTWTEAIDLEPGDHLHTDNGTVATVAATVILPASGYMWDLTVQGAHTFYIRVGDTSTLVHNINCPIAAVRGPNGENLPLPLGASGKPTRTGKGWAFDIPAGTQGLNSRVVEVRLMDPVTKGPNQYPNGYVVYMNAAGQSVNPLTGRTTVGKADPYAHLPIDPK